MSGRNNSKSRGTQTRNMSQRRTRKKHKSTQTSKKKVQLSLQQHQFCERAGGEIISIGNEAGTYAAPFYKKKFMFKDLKQCDAYSTIFEQYRLDKVVATFRYKGIATPAHLSGGPAWVNEMNPLIYFKVDHNDINVNTLAVMKTSTRTKTHQFSNDKPEFSITLKPAAQILMLRSVDNSVTPPVIKTTNVPKWKQWIDADGLSGPGSEVEHFGLKVYALGYKSSDFDPGTLDIEYKYYFSMKCNE